LSDCRDTRLDLKRLALQIPRIDLEAVASVFVLQPGGNFAGLTCMMAERAKA
jgi:hypothetical protein